MAEKYISDDLVEYFSGGEPSKMRRPTEECVTPLRLAKLNEVSWSEEEKAHIGNCHYCQRRIAGMFISICPETEELKAYIEDQENYFLAWAIEFHLNESCCSVCSTTVHKIRAQKNW